MCYFSVGLFKMRRSYLLKKISMKFYLKLNFKRKKPVHGEICITPNINPRPIYDIGVSG